MIRFLVDSVYSFKFREVSIGKQVQNNLFDGNSM
jgi:hypothetical protein